MGALVAICSSLLWGTSDFLGGRATQRWGALRVLAWAQLAMLVALWCIVAALDLGGMLSVSVRDVLIGAVGGVAGVIGLVAFYRALAIGPMVLVPPLAALGVALPVIVGLVTGGRVSAMAVGGLLVAVLGVVLASAAPPSGPEALRIAPRTIALCLVAAVGFALVIVAIDAASGDTMRGALVATAGVRLGSFITIALALAATRTSPLAGVSARAGAGFAGIGALDTSANLALGMATTIGRLEIVAVLGSLYPAVTSALAAALLGERIGRVQLVGVLTTFAGVAMLALG